MMTYDLARREKTRRDRERRLREKIKDGRKKWTGVSRVLWSTRRLIERDDECAIKGFSRRIERNFVR